MSTNKLDVSHKFLSYIKTFQEGCLLIKHSSRGTGMLRCRAVVFVADTYFHTTMLRRVSDSPCFENRGFQC